MIEDGFVQMYARDFVVLASRAELGTDVEQGLSRRIGEVRSHAQLMDARKGPGHLDAVAERLRHEAASRSIRLFRNGSTPEEALERRAEFLQGVISQIVVSNQDDGRESIGLEPTRIPRIRR